MRFSNSLTFKKPSVVKLRSLQVGDSFVDSASLDGGALVFFVVTEIMGDGMVKTIGLTPAESIPGWLPFTLQPEQDVIKVVGVDATVELEVA